MPDNMAAVCKIARGMRGKTTRKPKRLSQIFADIVCSRSKQDVKFMLVGQQGAGKSRSLLHLACECSKEVAARVGGSPEDYFPSDLSNVVIGDPAGHAELFQNMKQHAIIILDDAGVSLNARNFATTYNKSMNDVFQTMRTNRSIVLLSTPDTMTTDLIIRTMVSHYGEVAETHHARGYNLVKVFRVRRKHREGRTLYVYHTEGCQTVVRYKFLNPPEAMVKHYEDKRKAAGKLIASRAGKGKEREKAETFPPVTCPACGYSWTPRTKSPKICPSCQKWLNK